MPGQDADGPSYNYPPAATHRDCPCSAARGDEEIIDQGRSSSGNGKSCSTGLRRQPRQSSRPTPTAKPLRPSSRSNRTRRVAAAYVVYAARKIWWPSTLRTRCSSSSGRRRAPSCSATHGCHPALRRGRARRNSSATTAPTRCSRTRLCREISGDVVKPRRPATIALHRHRTAHGRRPADAWSGRELGIQVAFASTTILACASASASCCSAQFRLVRRPRRPGRTPPPCSCMLTFDFQYQGLSDGPGHHRRPLVQRRIRRAVSIVPFTIPATISST